MLFSFKTWLEVEEPNSKGIAYYVNIAGLPRNFSKSNEAYQLVEQAYIRLQSQRNPEAHEIYIRLHDYLDKQRGGKHFDPFFTEVTTGNKAYVPHTEFSPILDMSGQKDWMKVREQYHGNFDKHIKTSIPTFGELQDKKGHAIVTAFGNEEIDMLDIGGSEGSFARTISHISNGKVRTEILDPNDAMAEFYHSKGLTPGSKYNKAAFMHGWINEDGSTIPELNSKNTDKRYDIIHEAMAFQFINSHRDSQVAEVKALLKPTGMFLTEQKFKNDNWEKNEAFKDQHHKNLYYTPDALKQKEKVVAFAQSKDEEDAVGMVNNMVHHNEYEQVLAKNFQIVYQYWDSGNFKGYAASDQSGMVMQFLHALGNVSSKFTNVELPRRIVIGEHTMPSFKEWSKHHHHRDLIGGIIPSTNEVENMTIAQIKEKYGEKIIQAAAKLGVELTDDDIVEIICKDAGIEDIKPHISHYHLHM